MKDFSPKTVFSKNISIPDKCYIIAEIGINHNGDMDIAKQLIDVAVETGCDAVKFQKRTIDTVYTADYLKETRESPWGNTQRAQKEGLEFNSTQYDEIDRYCKEKGIDWMASAWDVESQEFLRKYNLPYNKVASPMLNHWDLLEAIASEKRPTFLSTGMSHFDDIDRAVKIFDDKECPVIPMHCVSEYPAKEEILNLKMLSVLAERYNKPVGYSGHEISPYPSVMAAMLGAVCIERHITLDRSMYGSDQSASLEKRGLEIMVKSVRSIPSTMGDGEKVVSEAETKNANKLRYHLELN